MHITVSKEWRPSRKGIMYVVQQMIFADFAGAGYRFFRNDRGRVVRFWTERAAQRFADKLNMENADGTHRHP